MAVSPRELHRVVPSVIIYNDEGKFLIAKRGMHKVFPGKWHVPGGGVSMDDYEHLPVTTTNDKQWYYVIEKGLKREVKEELGIEIGKTQYLLDVAFIRPDGIPVIVLTYYAPYAGGELSFNDEETTDAKWVTLEEAKSYDLIDGIWKELEMVDAILTNKKLEHGNTLY